MRRMGREWKFMIKKCTSPSFLSSPSGGRRVDLSCTPFQVCILAFDLRTVTTVKVSLRVKSRSEGQ